MSKGDIIFIVPDYLKQYNPQFISFFGSYARKEQTTTSDTDILEAFHNGIPLLKLIRLENELSELCI
jgi:predicted nucleotidyltransferase